jgi:hypothetical protein
MVVKRFIHPVLGLVIFVMFVIPAIPVSWGLRLAPLVRYAILVSIGILVIRVRLVNYAIRLNTLRDARYAILVNIVWQLRIVLLVMCATSVRGLVIFVKYV